MFGNFGTQQQQQNPAPTAPAQPSLFGGFGQNNQQQQQTQPQTGLFGAPAQPAQTQTQTQPPSLFGGFSTQNQNQQQQSGTGGLFGSTAATAPKPGGLFGTSTLGQPQQPNQAAPAPATGGLFGSTTTQPQTGLFGTTTQPAAAQPTTGLFGSTAPTQQPATGGFFGQPQQPAQQSNLFGAPKPTLTLGAPAAQANAIAPPPTELKGSTKFNDLPPDIAGILEQIDTFIQKQTNIGKELASRSFSKEPEICVKQLQKVATTANATANLLDADERFLADLRVKADKALADQIKASSIVLGWTESAEHGGYLITYADFPFEFFETLAAQLRDRLQRYKAIVEQIERKLTSAISREQYSPQAITATLRAQHTTFMSLAGKTAELHAQMQRIKDVYRALWQAQNSSARDPFDLRTGVESLSVSGLRVS